MSSLAMSSVTLISTFGSACMHTKSLQLCLTLCDPIDCQAPLFMGILQATARLLCSWGFSRQLISN